MNFIAILSVLSFLLFGFEGAVLDHHLDREVNGVIENADPIGEATIIDTADPINGMRLQED